MPQPNEFLHPDFRPIYEQELPAIQQRQQVAGVVRPADETASVPATVGFGLSGGGIRSGTFSLGIFQSLARLQLLRQIDWLSTVSGGGYFGAFLGRLFTRSSDDLKAAVRDTTAHTPKIPEQVERVLGEPDSYPNDWLRENGRFLAPNGSGNLLQGYAVVLRNWVAIHVVLASFLFLTMLSWQLVRFELPLIFDNVIAAIVYQNKAKFDAASDFMSTVEKWTVCWTGLLWWSPWLWLPLLWFVLYVFPLGWSFWLVQSSKERRSNYGGLVHWFGLALVAIIMAIELRCGWRITTSPQEPIVCQIGLPVTLITLLVYFLANRPERAPKSKRVGTSQSPATASHVSNPVDSGDEEDRKSEAHAARARNRLTLWLADSITVMLGLLIWCIVDSLGQTLYTTWRRGDLSIEWWISIGFALLNGGALFAQKLSPFFGSERGQRRPGGIMRIGGSLAAITLAMVSLSLLSALSHAAVWGWHQPKGDPGKKIVKHWREFGEKLHVLDAKSNKPTLDDDAHARPVGKQAANAAQKPRSSEAPTTHATRKTPARVAHGVSHRDLWGMWGLSLIFSLAFARVWPFLNRSTLQSLYNSRLRRAYLGASNPRRWKNGMQSVLDAIEGDGIPFRQYQPHHHGAPLHLINVTVNETVDGRSQIQQQDRHGVGMAVGPFGISVGLQHHASWCNGDMLLPPAYDPKKFQVFEDPNHPSPSPLVQRTPIPAEPLELSEWAGISGAAFSTGLGMRTSLSLSLLAGFFNVRLGYWWDSGVDPENRKPRVVSKGLKRAFALLNKLFPIPMYLLDEFTARFHGTARRRWYLTDGGHFENMAGYELLRRRVPLIVICDGEEDSHYTFEGLANLVRKAHIDFDADIRFWNADEIERRLGPGGATRLGSLDDLRRTFSGNRNTDKVVEGLGVASRAYSHRHAAIATVRYDASRPETQPGAVGLHTDASELQAGDSLLIYIKATITDDEPADVRQYSDEHPAFPHEPTIDQFFDEAQWESYRKLGEHISGLLFHPQAAPPNAGKGTGGVADNPDRPQGPWPPPVTGAGHPTDEVSRRIAQRLSLLMTRPSAASTPVGTTTVTAPAASDVGVSLPSTTDEDLTILETANSSTMETVIPDSQSASQTNLPPAVESPARVATEASKTVAAKPKTRNPKPAKRPRRR